MTPAQLMRLNEMSSRSIKTGQPIIVANEPVQQDTKKSTVKSKGTKANAAKSAHAKHKVRNGETLFSISQHYKCSLNELKRLNRIKGSRVNVGQIIVIP
jgi:LysM repeat protein